MLQQFGYQFNSVIVDDKLMESIVCALGGGSKDEKKDYSQNHSAFNGMSSIPRLRLQRPAMP